MIKNYDVAPPKKILRETKPQPALRKGKKVKGGKK